MQNKTPTTTPPKTKTDTPENVAKQIVLLIDTDGPGLSEEREARLTHRISEILKTELSRAMKDINDPSIKDRDAFIRIEELKANLDFMNSLGNPLAPDGAVNREVWKGLHQKAFCDTKGE